MPCIENAMSLTLHSLPRGSAGTPRVSSTLQTSPASLRSRAQDRYPVTAGDVVRRALNVVVATLGLIVTAPLMLVVGALVRLDSPGPAIYRQERVGLCRRGSRDWPKVDRRRAENLGGRVFTIFKFRTMTVAQDGREVWASRNDARITRVGRVLRATRIDELPQLLNVLQGDMNIVGPRPEQPGIFRELRDEVHGYDRRQKVLPGITGLAQVTLGYDTSIEDVRRKVEVDLAYIEGRSTTQDLLIMVKTVPVVVFQKVWM